MTLSADRLHVQSMLFVVAVVMMVLAGLVHSALGTDKGRRARNLSHCDGIVDGPARLVLLWVSCNPSPLVTSRIFPYFVRVGFYPFLDRRSCFCLIGHCPLSRGFIAPLWIVLLPTPTGLIGLFRIAPRPIQLPGFHIRSSIVVYCLRAPALFTRARPAVLSHFIPSKFIKRLWNAAFRARLCDFFIHAVTAVTPRAFQTSRPDRLRVPEISPTANRPALWLAGRRSANPLPSPLRCRCGQTCNLASLVLQGSRREPGSPDIQIEPAFPRFQGEDSYTPCARGCWQGFVHTLRCLWMFYRTFGIYLNGTRQLLLVENICRVDAIISNSLHVCCRGAFTAVSVWVRVGSAVARAISPSHLNLLRGFLLRHLLIYWLSFALNIWRALEIELKRAKHFTIQRSAILFGAFSKRIQKLAVVVFREPDYCGGHDYIIVSLCKPVNSQSCKVTHA